MNRINGGETGIRTQERVAPLPVFKTSAFNRSAISPLGVFISLIETFQLKRHTSYLFFLHIVQVMFRFGPTKS